MSEKQSSDSSSNSEQPAKKKRRSRRRPVKRNKNAAAGKTDSKNESKSKGKSRDKERINERARNERRRRRRRSASPSNNAAKGKKETDGAAHAATLDIDYVAPESVFIYTHVARKDQRDAGYEFRPDHFTPTGRRPEDFQIDISSIVGTILDVEEGSKGILHDFVWDDDRDEETVFERPEVEQNSAEGAPPSEAHAADEEHSSQKSPKNPQDKADEA